MKITNAVTWTNDTGLAAHTKLVTKLTSGWIILWAFFTFLPLSAFQRLYVIQFRNKKTKFLL